MINLSMQQLESIKSYLEDWFVIPKLEDCCTGKEISEIDYLLEIAKVGITKLIERKIITLKEITIDILKTDSVLIPVCVLEALIKG